MAKGTLSPQRMLPAAIVAMLVLALLPTRATRWLEWFRGPVEFVLTPVSNAAALVSRTFRPAISGTLPSDPDVAHILIEREQFKTMWMDAERRIGLLEERVRELQRGLELAPEAPIRTFHARVVGSSSDPSDGLLTVRAGRNRGVTEGDSVAVVNGVHLVGRVVDVRAATCSVLPVSRSAAGYIEALVIVDDEGRSVRCQVRGTSDGTLRGDLAEGAAGVEPGQEVRLLDGAWPESAQMLILGRVERAPEKKENAPLRMVVTVRPDVQLDRVQTVALRVPLEIEELEGEGVGSP